MPWMLARVQARTRLDNRFRRAAIVGTGLHAARAHAPAPPADAVRVLPRAVDGLFRGHPSRAVLGSSPAGGSSSDDPTGAPAPVDPAPPLLAPASDPRAAVPLLDAADRSSAPPRALSVLDYAVPAVSSRRCVFSL